MTAAKTVRPLLLAVVAASATGVSSAAAAEAAPDAGTAFEPKPASAPRYAVLSPRDHAEQQAHVPAASQGRLYLESWRPGPRAGHRPPARVPAVLVHTPYEDITEKLLPLPLEDLVEHLVPRGYAVVIAHVAGTGKSGGCSDIHGPKDTEDTLRLIEFVRTRWSNGRVGMYGISYYGGTITGAITSGDPRGDRLGAAVPMAATMSTYDVSHFDGIPLNFGLPVRPAAVQAAFGVPADGTPPPARERGAVCADTITDSTNPSGDFTPFYALREHRRRAHRVRVPVLYPQGLDDGAPSRSTAGFLDRLPKETPHKVLVGQWRHVEPQQSSRPDWWPMVTAWFDRWLREAPTGAERWPEVQVQDLRGQWRAEPEWPTTGGPAGQLALSADGRLGAASPEGPPTPVLEASGQPPYGRGVTFGTSPLAAPLHLTGQPELDVWVTSDRDDAHLTVRLFSYDASGMPLPQGQIVGARSLQHLEPFVHGRFEQKRGTPFPAGDDPVNVRVRLDPVDLRIPVGGRLEVSLAGSTGYEFGGVPEQGLFPAYSGATLNIHHDCEHPSALRFLMPREGSRLLNVRDREPVGEPLRTTPSPRLQVDGGGLARTPVCGRAPKRSDVLGPARRYASGDAPARAQARRTSRR